MGALSNIKVVDLTHVVAGPFCTYQLAVMGADVIKIESPDLPDMVRARTPEFPHGEKGLSAFFNAQNAGKRAIAVDLKTPQGLEVIKRLLADADVLVENYRAGAMAALGLGYDDVCTTRPDIIYCSMTGFGQSGPKAQHNAFDNVIQAFSGLMASNGDEESAPVKIGPPVLASGTGIQAACAIVCALLERSRSGRGQHIDIAMLDAALMLMGSAVTYCQEEGTPRPLSGNMSPDNAGYCCYRASDGLVMLGAYTGTQVADMWRVIGEAEYGERFRGLPMPAMRATYAEDRKRIAEIIADKPAAYWETEFNANRVPAARVRTLDEAIDERQLEHRLVLQTPGTNGQRSYPTAAFSFTDDGPSLSSPPPVFAQHTREILMQHDYSAEQVDALAATGVVSEASKISKARTQ